MTHKLFSSIQARSQYMFAVFVEKIIIPPTKLSENPEFFQTNNTQVSFIGNIGMERSYAGNFHKFSEDYGLPPEYELRMVMNNIWLKIPNLVYKRGCKTKSNLEVRIEKCRKSFYRKYLDTRILKIRNSRIVWYYDAYLMPPIRKFSDKRYNTRNNAVRGRKKGVRKINNSHECKQLRKYARECMNFMTKIKDSIFYFYLKNTPYNI